MTPTATRRFVALMGEARLERGSGHMEPAAYERPEPFFVGKEAFIMGELFTEERVWSPYPFGGPEWNTYHLGAHTECRDLRDVVGRRS